MDKETQKANEALDRAIRILKVPKSDVGIKHAHHINFAGYNLTDIIAALTDRIEELEKRVASGS